MLTLREGRILMHQNSVYQALRLNYLYVDRYSFPKEWSYFESIIPYSMIRLIKSGYGKFVINDTEYIVEENNIIYIPQGCKLACESLSEEFTFISIRFTASIPLNDIELWSDTLGLNTKIVCNDVQVRDYFNQMIVEKQTNHKGKSFLLRGYLELIIGYVINSSELIIEEDRYKNRKTLVEKKLDNRVQTIIDYMINHPEKNMCIDEMSSMANISSSSLRRLFKLHTGKSPSAFLIELKMTYAARSLLESDESISYIGYSLGFEDINYFSRVFKKHFGVTPSSYRKVSRD
ncbi:AraC family transcriptional regulator [Virgibacillus phasianinus]|uniref:AraC family transcriptional regulator n=1 Tax=Virgibacillus phasianinus TaxID=2017483 RepID=A0A220U7X8_9BACI|nr:AraC family transcriptional regulator [Virgibacillus phasianinus]ASK64145.1 AraC family transcriptional regulator [Virgibacillus phasianinus]